MKFGLASSNNDILIFISDFLDVIKDAEVLVTLTSKVEYLTNQILVDYKNSIMLDAGAIRYAFVKSIDQHKPADVIEAIENQDESLIQKLITFYEERIENKVKLTLKRRGNSTFEQLLVVLFEVNTDIKLQWKYDTTFECVNKLMIPNQDTNLLVLDEEGTGRSIDSALSAGIKIYKDVNRHQYLNLLQKEQIYFVLSVGFREMTYPIITIKINGKVEYYRRPDILYDWVLVEMGYANSGEIKFPSYVKFKNTSKGIVVENFVKEK